MAMAFQILGSSSSGNCALLRGEGGNCLIDAGFSGRRIEGLLAEAGLALEELNAVFLTHDHSDHIAGVRGLARLPHLEFFANAGTAEAVQRGLSRKVRWRLFESGQRFRFGGYEVQTVPLPHDAYDPVGFIFRSGGQDLFDPFRSVAWLTDLGYVPPGLAAHLADVHVLVLEANHDEALLDMDTKRPFSVKQRIRGRHGHLSNSAANQFLHALQAPHLRRVFLAHLSRDCNSLESVRTTFSDHSGRGYAVEIIDPEGGPHTPLNLLDWS